MALRLPAPQPLAIAVAAAVPTTLWIADGVVMRRRLAAARRDPLTGLLARDGYTRAATQLVARHGDHALVVFLDVVDFKALNDRYGHAAGDRVLAELGARLAQWAGPRGVAARLHGDELAAAVRSPVHRRGARLAQLHRALHQPVRFDSVLVDVGVSIGAASPSDLHTRDLPQLLRGADAAMYEHKRERTGHYRLATPAHAATPTVNGRRLGRPGTGPQSLAA